MRPPCTQPSRARRLWTLDPLLGGFPSSGQERSPAPVGPLDKTWRNAQRLLGKCTVGNRFFWALGGNQRSSKVEAGPGLGKK